MRSVIMSRTIEGSAMLLALHVPLEARFQYSVFPALASETNGIRRFLGHLKSLGWMSRAIVS